MVTFLHPTQFPLYPYYVTTKRQLCQLNFRLVFPALPNRSRLPVLWIMPKRQEEISAILLQIDQKSSIIYGLTEEREGSFWQSFILNTVPWAPARPPRP
jgi:hypothetical protein